MSARDDGGPVFPVPLDTALMAGLNTNSGALGISMRQYYAAKAMQAILTTADWSNSACTPQVICHDSFVIADAMIAAEAA